VIYQMVSLTYTKQVIIFSTWCKIMIYFNFLLMGVIHVLSVGIIADDVKLLLSIIKHFKFSNCKIIAYVALMKLPDR